MKTPIEVLEEFLDTWDTTQVPSVYSSDISLYRVPVYGENVGQHIKKLSTWSRLLQADSPIPNVSIRNRVQQVALRDLFQDDKGYYEDANTRLEELRVESLILIRLVREKAKTEQSDQHSFHNRLVLAPVLQDLVKFYHTFQYGTLITQP